MSNNLTCKQVKKMYLDSGVDRGRFGIYYFAFQLYDTGRVKVGVFIKFLGRYLEIMKAQRHKYVGRFDDEISAFILGFPFGKRITKELYFENEQVIKNYVSILFYVTGYETGKLDVKGLSGHGSYMVYNNKYIYSDLSSSEYGIREVFKDTEYLGLSIKFFNLWEDIALLNFSDDKAYKKGNSDMLLIFNSKNEMYRSLIL